MGTRDRKQHYDWAAETKKREAEEARKKKAEEDQRRLELQRAREEVVACARSPVRVLLAAQLRSTRSASRAACHVRTHICRCAYSAQAQLEVRSVMSDELQGAKQALRQMTLRAELGEMKRRQEAAQLKELEQVRAALSRQYAHVVRTVDGARDAWQAVAEAQKRHDELESGRMCRICLDSPLQIVLQPCGHLCLCEACAARILKSKQPQCPLCRARPTTFQKVFH